MRKRSELFFSVILVPLDFLALLGAFVAAYVIRVKLEDKPVSHPIAAADFVHVLLILLPLWIIIFALSGLYVQSNLRGRLTELGKVFVAVSSGVMLSILLDFFQPQSLFPSKAVPIYAYGLGLVFVLVSRAIVRGLQRWLFQYGIGVHNTIIIGSGEIAQRLYPDLQQPFSGYRLLACVDTARGAAKRMKGVPVYSTIEEAVAENTKYGQLDEIIQADSALDQYEVLDLVNYAANQQIGYRFVPNPVLGTLAGVQLIEIRLTPLDGWGRVAKRIFDLVGSIFGIVVLSPVFLAVALAVKLRDPKGPIFYHHYRLSRNGQPVNVIKFRTMLWKYCDGPGRPYRSPEATFKAMGRSDLIEEFKAARKLHDDPRVSSLGRFLRRTSLDELPQLFNVLRGDMSLVGPRPIVKVELEHYGDRGAIFLALKPGITGLWQISGRSDISYDDRVKLDIFYVEHWSLLLDTKILFKTVFAILRGSGAY
jgi:exopolysaccharide biosynthesis polyprenyl glycosylphosphotransferase